jgi:hypothetical protein
VTSAHETTTEISDILISSSASAAAMKYGCRNSILPLVSLFYAWRASEVLVWVAF